MIGATFMEGFYTVFDRQNKRVGFAVSSCIEPGSSNIMMANSSGELVMIDLNLVVKCESS